jgi:hypothetical protein
MTSFQHGEDRLPHPGSIDGNKFLWTGDGDANHIHPESHAKNRILGLRCFIHYERRL